MRMHMVLVVVMVLVSSTVTTDKSLLRIIKCPIMSDQNIGWSDTMSDQVFRIILNSVYLTTFCTLSVENCKYYLKHE